MGDYADDLAAALALAEKEISGNTYYDIFSDAITAAGSAAAKTALSSHDPDYGLAIGASVVPSLFGGALDELGRQSANDQLNDYADLLYGSLQGKMYEKPESLSDRLYDKANRQAKLIRTKEAIRQAKEKRDRAIELDTGIRKKFGETIAGEAAQDSWTRNLERRAMATKAEGNTRGILDPVSKELKAVEDSATKDIEKLPSVGKLRMVQTALADLEALAPLDTGSSDIQFATLFLQGLDGSVVREGEYDRVRGANPLVQAWANKLEAVLNGKSSLGPAIKKQMFNELLVRGRSLSKLAEADVGRVVGRAGRYHADPERIGVVSYEMPHEPFHLDEPVKTFGNPKTKGYSLYELKQMEREAQKKRLSEGVD